MACYGGARDSVTVHFRQSHVELDPGFGGNGAALDSIFSHLEADSTHRSLKEVRVTGGASPEGSVRFNRYLSERRAEAIFEAIGRRGFLGDSVSTDFVFLGRDWAGLRALVENDPAVPYRADVLGLLDVIMSDNAPAHPLARLKVLHGGEPYFYMYRNLFPQLRESRLVLEYADLLPFVHKMSTGSAARIPVDIVTPDHPELTITAPVYPLTCRPFYMGLKTNLLYDALALPNIGAEFYVGKNWSVFADWMYGWWDRDRTHHYWRAYGGTLGARRWFGSKAAEKPLTGHHLGVFAGVVTYDFELGGTGYMGGIPGRTLWDRCNLICGIEYGYSMPVARRLNLDFTIGLGYLGGKYYKYVPRDGYYEWQSTHRLNWIGPVKAEVALVWLIGCDNYNRKKGGRL